jgi:hypothetical protein
MMAISSGFSPKFSHGMLDGFGVFPIQQIRQNPYSLDIPSLVGGLEHEFYFSIIYGSSNPN